MKLKPSTQKLILSLPEDVLRAVSVSYHGLLDQKVYNVSQRRIESIWAMDLCAPEGSYVTASMIAELTHYRYNQDCQLTNEAIAERSRYWTKEGVAR